jgi:hypothetical protein
VTIGGVTTASEAASFARADFASSDVESGAAGPDGFIGCCGMPVAAGGAMGGPWTMPASLQNWIESNGPRHCPTTAKFYLRFYVNLPCQDCSDGLDAQANPGTHEDAFSRLRRQAGRAHGVRPAPQLCILTRCNQPVSANQRFLAHFLEKSSLLTLVRRRMLFMVVTGRVEQITRVINAIIA